MATGMQTPMAILAPVDNPPLPLFCEELPVLVEEGIASEMVLRTRMTGIAWKVASRAEPLLPM